MRYLRVFMPLFVFFVLTLCAIPLLYSQKLVTVSELSEQRRTLDRKLVRVVGVFHQTHIGPLLEDRVEKVAARIRFKGAPTNVVTQTERDDLYNQLYVAANSIPDPDDLNAKYEVELLAFLQVAKKRQYNIYKDSPLELYPIRVSRFTRLSTHTKDEERNW